MAGWMSENNKFSPSRYLPYYYLSLFSTQITEVILSNLKLLLKLLSSFLHSNCAFRSNMLSKAQPSLVYVCIKMLF